MTKKEIKIESSMKVAYAKDNPDGSFEVVWDENNPEEAIFNTWTKQVLLIMF